jgi:hypothetical protein
VDNFKEGKMSKSISEARKWLEKIQRLHEHGAGNCSSQANSYRNEIGEIYKKAKDNDKPGIASLYKEATNLNYEIEKRER